MEEAPWAEQAERLVRMGQDRRDGGVAICCGRVVQVSAVCDSTSGMCNDLELEICCDLGRALRQPGQAPHATGALPSALGCATAVAVLDVSAWMLHVNAQLKVGTSFDAPLTGHTQTDLQCAH